MIKKYIAFFILCVIILVIGIIVSIPIKVEVHSVGEKPPLWFAVFFSVLLLSTIIATLYASYLYWFQKEKSRTNLEKLTNTLQKKSFFFRLPIYNPKFLFWFIRLFMPIAFIMLLGIFLLTILTAF